MKYIFLFRFVLIITSLISHTHASCYNNKALNEREGLRFENIGKLKLITRFHKMTFTVDLSQVELLMSATEKLLKESRLKFSSDKNFQNVTGILLYELEEQHKMFEDIFKGNHQWIKPSTLRRQKRFVTEIMNLFFHEDRERLSEDVNNLRNYTNNLIDVIEKLTRDFNSSVSYQNATYINLFKNSIVTQVKIELGIVSECIQSFLIMQHRKKLSTIFVSFSEFNSSLSLIAKHMLSSEQLPYSKINQYFYNLEVMYEVKNKSLVLTVNVPFVEVTTRKLFKIHEIPSYIDGKLMITDVGWKYLAVDEVDMVMFTDNKRCLNGAIPDMYLCEPESHTENLVNSSSCLGNAFNFKTINSTMCQTSGAEFSHLTFIKLRNGEYFYYTPVINVTIIEIYCNDSIVNEVLQYHIGVLSIQGARAKTGKFELISTKGSPHKEINSTISITYTEGELNETIKNIVKKFKEYSKAYENLNVFREEVQNLGTINNAKQNDTPSPGIKIDIKVVFAATVIIIFGIIVVRSILVKHCSKEKSCFNRNKENKIVKVVEGNSHKVTV